MGAVVVVVVVVVLVKSKSKLQDADIQRIDHNKLTNRWVSVILY